MNNSDILPKLILFVMSHLTSIKTKNFQNSKTEKQEEADGVVSRLKYTRWLSLKKKKKRLQAKYLLQAPNTMR